jgi:hypothetical protein
MPKELLAGAHPDDDHRLGVVDPLAAERARRFLRCGHAAIIGTRGNVLQERGARWPPGDLSKSPDGQRFRLMRLNPLRLSCLGSQDWCAYN